MNSRIKLMTNPVEEEVEEVREEIVPGVARALSPMARRILAMNPGPRTGLGTNTYMVGIDEIAVIDPGPDDQDHLDSIIGCGGDLIRWILVTNNDPEHAGAVPKLAKQTGAIVMAMCDIECDVVLKDGQQLVGTEFRLTTRHLPGPSAKNVGFMLEEERMLISGDLIVDGPSVGLNAPPDGDMTAYLQSLESLKKLRLKRIAPGHGYVIEEPKPVVQEYIDHRMAREAAILKTLGSDTMRVEDIIKAVYGEVEEDVAELAVNNALAHLVKLRTDGKVKGTKNFTAI
jgi:glyoxylase-like metal-dependent hydrolase (beta-lactamase superfamily II)